MCSAKNVTLLHTHWSKVWRESPSNLLRGKQAWQMWIFTDRLWSFKLGCFYFQFQFLKEQCFIQVSKSPFCSLGHIHQRLPIKNPSHTWQRGWKIFVLAALKFWNPEEDSYYLFDLCEQKGKSIWYLIISDIQDFLHRVYTSPLLFLC